MLRRRITTRFTIQLVIAGILLIALALTSLIWMVESLNKLETERNFASYGLIDWFADAKLDENNLIVTDEILPILIKNNGWLQIVDEHGYVKQAINTFDDVPSYYEPGLLIDHWNKQTTFPYTLGMWLTTKKDQSYILVYGEQLNQNESLLEIKQHTTINGKQLILSEANKAILNELDGWMQIIDPSGNEVASYHRPDDAPLHYTLSELAMRSMYHFDYGYRFQSHFDEQTKLTWILQYPIEENYLSEQFNQNPSLHASTIFLVGVVGFIIATLIILLILALSYAHFFVRPALDVVNSIQQMATSEGKTSSKVKPLTIRKRSKHLFREMLDAIDQLKLALEASNQAKLKTQQYREEWIAGVTHDMKTPLSSIQGYAHLLAAEQYEWTANEVQSFAQTMIKKSQYMDQLIEDLALTYRLRSGHYEVTFEHCLISPLLVELIERVKAYPISEQMTIQFIQSNQPVTGYIYRPWFERMVENLIVNAVTHNPAGTVITISLQEQNDGWSIQIKDNGNGIDDGTKSVLFERYYRGTNTDENSIGSGLGMAIAKELAQAMNGTIEVNTALGAGTRIMLAWKYDKKKQ